MDGYEVCRRLRQMPETAEVPIMFLSSLEEVQNKTRGFEAGANDYLTKPFEMLEVKARVRSLLKAKAYSDAVKEQIASELRVAREIQMGMLPHDFAAMEQAYGVEFGAVLEPAREVGGDLYGVCAAAEDRLVVFLGDVSGKGIPASMFMVRAISLARLLAREIAEPERILARLNDELAGGQSVVHVRDFPLRGVRSRHRDDSPWPMAAIAARCSSARANRRAGRSRISAPRWASTPGLEFERTELTLRPGDSLVFYTDGVSEAFNPQDECYGDDRLLADTARVRRTIRAPALTAGLLEKVRAFADSAPQSDDIAILTLKVERSGRRPRMTLELHAHARGSHARGGGPAGVRRRRRSAREDPLRARAGAWRSAAATSSTTRCSAMRGRHSA